MNLCDYFEFVDISQDSRRQPNSFSEPVYWILILATSPRSRLLARPLSVVQLPSGP